MESPNSPELEPDLRGLVLLEMVPASLRNAIRSRPDRSAKLNVSTRSVVNIGSLKFDSSSFGSAARALFSGADSMRLETADGQQVTMEASGSSVDIVAGEKRYHLKDLELLSDDQELRTSAYDRVAKDVLSPTVRWEDIRRQVQRGPLTDEAFHEMQAILRASPPVRVSGTAKRIAGGTLGLFDLCPNEGEYWDSLLGTYNSDGELGGLIQQLHSAQNSILAHSNLETALPFLLATSGSSAFRGVWGKSYTTSDLDAAIAEHLDLLPPLSLVAALEVLADRSSEADSGIAKLVLAKLTSDRAWLASMSEVFSAIFRAVFAQLCSSSYAGRSWAWRRLAAYTQANLLSPVIAEQWSAQPNLRAWFHQLAVARFPLQIALDAAHAPRWRDDWSLPPYIHAETVGRLRFLAELSPAESKRWGLPEMIAEAVSDAEERSVAGACGYPGPLEGVARMGEPLTPEDEAVVRAWIDELGGDSGLRSLALILSIARVCPPCPELKAAVERSLKATPISVLRSPGISAGTVIHGLGWASANFKSATMAEQTLRLAVGLDRTEIEKDLQLVFTGLVYGSVAVKNDNELHDIMQRGAGSLAYGLHDRETLLVLHELIERLIELAPHSRLSLSPAKSAALSGGLRR